MFVQIIQAGVIGRLTARYSERSLLLLAIGISSFVGLAQVHTPEMMFINVLYWTDLSKQEKEGWLQVISSKGNNPWLKFELKKSLPFCRLQCRTCSTSVSSFPRWCFLSVCLVSSQTVYSPRAYHPLTQVKSYLNHKINNNSSSRDHFRRRGRHRSHTSVPIVDVTKSNKMKIWNMHS